MDPTISPPESPSVPAPSRPFAWGFQEIPWLRSPWFLGLLLALGVMAIYSNSLGGEWLYDDYAAVFGNPAVQQLSDPGASLSRLVGNFVGAHPRPLVSLTFSLNYLFGKNIPLTFHLTNVAIHTLAAFCLFGLLRRTLARLPQTASSASILAFTTALLWSIHPLQTEAVAYITQRYESLMGLFVLLTLLCVSRSASSRHSEPWLVAASLSCLLALASKEVAVSLPILVLLYDRTFLAGSFREAWRARRPLYLAFLLAWALFGWNQAHIHGRQFAGFGLTATLPWWRYAMNQPAVILHYLRLVFWPHPLVLDYLWTPAPSIGPLLPGFFVIGSLLAGTAVALVRAPRWGFLGAFFFLILAPTSSIMPILDLAVEHRMYLPLAPLLTGLVLGLYGLAHGTIARRASLAVPLRRTALVVGALAVALMGSLAYLRSEDYQSGISIWLDTILKRPNNPRAHSNYAHALYQAGRTDEAIREVRIALAYVPGNAVMHDNLGAFLNDKGRHEEACAEFQLAIQLNPGEPKFRTNLAKASLEQGDSQKAEGILTTVLAMNPGYVPAHFELGNLFRAKGDPGKALAHYREAVRLQPGFTLAHWGVGILLLEQGHLQESLDAFRNYAELEQNPANAWTIVAQSLYMRGYAPEALQCWRRALKHEPKRVSTLLLMSWALSTNPHPEYRNGPEALALAEAALRNLPEKTPAALETLGTAYAEMGRFPEACQAVQDAICILGATEPVALTSLQSRLAMYRQAHPYHEDPSIHLPPGTPKCPPVPRSTDPGLRSGTANPLHSGVPL